MTKGPFGSFLGVRVGGGLDQNGAEFMRPTMFGAFSGQVPRLVSQKLVKDPHNLSKTEAKPKRNLSNCEIVIVKVILGT